LRSGRRCPGTPLGTGRPVGLPPPAHGRRPGEVAARGDVVDIFAPGCPWPLRFEFFGDTIENIRCFDPATSVPRPNWNGSCFCPWPRRSSPTPRARRP
jgi:hypothetical protein